MKLVVIQGRVLARYEGRRQTTVVVISNWDDDYRLFIEDYRVRGAEAL